MGLGESSYEAFCFDQAIGYVGRRIEGELEAVEGKNSAEMRLKRQAILDKYFSGGKKSGFADPAAMMAKVNK